MNYSSNQEPSCWREVDIAGKVVDIFVKKGDRVTSGEVLIEIAVE